MESSNARFVGMKNLLRLFEKLGKKKLNTNSNSITRKLESSIATTVMDANWKKFNPARQFTNAFNAKTSFYAKPASSSAAISDIASSAKQQHKKSGDSVKIEKAKRNSIASKG